MNNATWQDVQREQNGLRITGALAILSFIIGIFAMFYSVMHFHGSFIGMWLFVVAFIFMILFVRRVAKEGENAQKCQATPTHLCAREGWL